jgi:hypothetical protein
MADLPKSTADYKKLDHSFYDSAREHKAFFIDKKAQAEAPVTGYNYIFFTSPELGITRSKFENLPNVSNPDLLIRNNAKELKLPSHSDSIYTEDIVKMLAGEQGIFMPLLSNRATSLPASSQVLETLDYSETWNKYKMILGTGTKDSRIGVNFELLFKEDDNLTVLKSMKLWQDWIEGVFFGRVISAYSTFSALDEAQTAIIDYMSSLYTFSLRPDGKTIQHFAKYTGVFPIKQPYDQFASEDGDIKILSTVGVDFAAAYKEDMDIQILRDFNLLGQNNKSVLLDPKGMGPYFDGNAVKIPPIGTYPGIAKVTNKDTGKITYELHLTDPDDITGLTKNF